MKIGLFGFGCVGKGLYDVLSISQNKNAEIVKVCVKDRQKKRAIGDGLITFDKEDILQDESVNLVVELIDDAEQAFEIVSKALKAGKSVVTANKKMLAEHFEELLALQKSSGKALLYEAAACASIPIIRNLEEYYDTDSLNRIEGIVNGSTNYILSRSQAEGLSYKETLRLAQELGYAESDPSLDVEGHDAANKLSILCAHAFGRFVSPSELPRVGISQVGLPELKFARQNDWKIKLLARAYKTEQGLVAFVLPSFVDSDSPLYKVDDVFNGVITETVFADRQFFSGRGAGAFPTASAVLSDISALSYDYRYEYKKLGQGKSIALDTEELLSIYLRSTRENEAVFLKKFEQVSEVFKSGAHLHICGKIKLKEIFTWLEENLDLTVIHLPETYDAVYSKELPILETENAFEL